MQSSSTSTQTTVRTKINKKSRMLPLSIIWTESERSMRAELRIRDHIQILVAVLGLVLHSQSNLPDNKTNVFIYLKVLFNTSRNWQITLYRVENCTSGKRKIPVGGSDAKQRMSAIINNQNIRTRQTLIWLSSVSLNVKKHPTKTIQTAVTCLISLSPWWQLGNHTTNTHNTNRNIFVLQRSFFYRKR